MSGALKFFSHYSSRAFSDMFVPISREIKQSVFAPTAASMKSIFFAPGILAITSSRILVTVQPLVRFADVTVAVVVMRSAGNPMRSIASDKAIEKEAA
jgi:hypothetical protein